jgi:hypothetical protein
MSIRRNLRFVEIFCEPCCNWTLPVQRSAFPRRSLRNTSGPSPVLIALQRRRKTMAQPERYENLVLGSGAGGKLIAWDMAQSGRRTAVVERRWIGGSCPNIACLPSKNEIRSAEVAASHRAWRRL